MVPRRKKYNLSSCKDASLIIITFTKTIITRTNLFGETVSIFMIHYLIFYLIDVLLQVFQIVSNTYACSGDFFCVPLNRLSQFSFPFIGFFVQVEYLCRVINHRIIKWHLNPFVSIQILKFNDDFIQIFVGPPVPRVLHSWSFYISFSLSNYPYPLN